MPDYSMDEKMFRINDNTMGIPKEDFDITKKTQHPAGTTLYVDNATTHQVEIYCHADNKGNWIEY